ncbi:hypothetical protein GN956_G4699 [Arapaima gigas]
MGNHLCRRRRKAVSGGAEAKDAPAGENDGKVAAEDVLYATIEHNNGEAVEIQLETDNSCDYAIVNIPSKTTHVATILQDSTDDYVLMS